MNADNEGLKKKASLADQVIFFIPSFCMHSCICYCSSEI
ncbi:hypothetical protein NC651_028749 [Populus alba x Populus x berolinensis]|nr:hypothetical protein NC651_028749 [Populus alba x Populus x berolinensis]